MIAIKIEIIFILRSKNGDFGRFERRLIRSTLGFFETLRLRFVRVFESSFRSQLWFKRLEFLYERTNYLLTSKKISARMKRLKF